MHLPPQSLHKGIEPVDALSPREVECCIEPLRRRRAAFLARKPSPNMLGVQLMDAAIHDVALGLLRLNQGLDIDVDEPSHFMVSQT